MAWVEVIHPFLRLWWSLRPLEKMLTLIICSVKLISRQQPWYVLKTYYYAIWIYEHSITLHIVFCDVKNVFLLGSPAISFTGSTNRSAWRPFFLVTLLNCNNINIKEYTGNCGNCTTAVAPYAIDERLVKAVEPGTNR